jgi:hypothetical protein
VPVPVNANDCSYGQKCIYKILSSLVVEFQDGWGCDCIWPMVFWVSKIVNEYINVEIRGVEVDLDSWFQCEKKP